LFERDLHDRAFNGVIGIDAPSAAGGLMTVAHILYKPVEDESTSALALAYVHGASGRECRDDPARSSPVGDHASRPRRSRPAAAPESPFTQDEADRIRSGARVGGR
jgi:hypothetical protein